MQLKKEHKNNKETLSYFGIFIIISSILISILNYKGYSGVEYFLPSNHLISELGNSSKSSLYYFFNYGMILSGALIAVSLILVETDFKIVLLFTKISLIGIIGIGFFPEDINFRMHLASAILFFASSGCGVLILTFQYLKDKTLANRVKTILISFLTLFFLICLMLVPKSLLYEAINLKRNFIRPAFWWLAIIEWLYVINIIIWFLNFLTLIRKKPT